MKFEKRDFTIYEGKEIYCFGRPAIVQGCDYDIGITIVSKEDPNLRLICLVNSDNVKALEGGVRAPGDYKAFFCFVLSGIIKGRIERDSYNRTKARLIKHFFGNVRCFTYPKGVPESECAFAQ